MILQNSHSFVSDNNNTPPTPLQNITNTINYKIRKSSDVSISENNNKIDDSKQESGVLAQMVTARLIKLKSTSAN